MTAVPKVTGSKLLVQLGDGASPENFDHDCLINTKRGIQFTSETNETIMPDCDNPDDPAWKAVTKDGLQATISGAGMLYTASLGKWWTWFNGDIAKNIRFNVTPTGYWEGAFKLTQFEVTGDSNKDVATSNVTIVSDGAVTWTANP
ncbi:conserved hypothetical protein [Mesorhizobium plurifarium]|uniref:Uncharacterized protein n=1 Tax=Mesorhizobium plurifarium TaxID=69974 RepID=A0A0K2VMR6_MESPL|nr:conserved hypothetical protein [Mesorhizobium plurifarium]